MKCAKCLGSEILDFLTDEIDGKKDLVNLYSTSGFQALALSLLTGKLKVAKGLLKAYGFFSFGLEPKEKAIKIIDSYFEELKKEGVLHGQSKSNNGMDSNPRPGCCGSNLGDS